MATGPFDFQHTKERTFMKNRSIFTIILLLSLALAGCNDEDDAPQSKEQSAELDRLSRELQKAETNVSKQESAKAWWQSIATALAVAAIALLIIGTIIGSSARHESER
jgi:hypothetical protein